MQQVYMRQLIIGKGRPKICVPVIGEKEEDILVEMEKTMKLPADLIEWRGDWYEDIFDTKKRQSLLLKIREVIGEKPLLFTYRSLQEGGQRAASPGVYQKLNEEICASGLVDAVDVELFMGDKFIKPIIDAAHKAGIPVIGSNHDFFKTPDKEEIIRRLILMEEAGADVLKIAVMPQTEADVLELLSASEEMKRLYTDQPLILISMGELGLVSRIAGETFGSAITFGAGETGSAPGQMNAVRLEKVLDWIHESMA